MLAKCMVRFEMPWINRTNSLVSTEHMQLYHEWEQKSDKHDQLQRP